MNTQRIFLLPLLLLSLICSRLHADSVTVTGMVSGTWDVDTVNVAGDLVIREVESLIIEPGVLVRFLGEFCFKVQGSLRAEGTADNQIRFTMADTTGFYNDTLAAGGWKQIRIEQINPAVDSSVFKYCRFEFGKAVAADSVYGYGGAICIRNTHKVEIAHCQFDNNYAFFSGGAVYLNNASVHVHHCEFTGNRCGQPVTYFGYGGGLCSDWGEPNIERNYFYGNSSTGIAGGLCVRFKDCPVFHNIFDNNFSALGGGFGILHIDTCRYVISNNLVINNGALFFGAGISNNNCSPVYVNNTIAMNHCQGGGGGFYCKDSVVPKLYNNILFGNTQYGGEANQVYLWDLLAQPDFFFNDVQGGKENFAGTGGSAFSGAYVSNLDVDPDFEYGSFALYPSSPCVNAGNPDTAGLMFPEFDLAGQVRIIQSIADLGAFENQNPVSIKELPENPVATLAPPFPNPARSQVGISFELQENAFVEVIIADAGGRTLETILKENKSAGKHEISFNAGSRYNPGTYTCILISGKHRQEQKLIILN